MIEPIVNQNFGTTFHHQNGKISVNTYTKTSVKSINPYPIKYQGHNQLKTWKKTALNVELKKRSEIIVNKR